MTKKQKAHNQADCQRSNDRQYTLTLAQRKPSGSLSISIFALFIEKTFVLT